jgi:hypothetical protein
MVKQESANKTIPTYFSHSYRLEDQEINETFWRLFSQAGFSFFVDPPSDTTIHTHLERMMGRCSACVAVISRRRDVARFFCSRFVLYEYGLSLQARRPRLLLIDRRVPNSPFQALPPEQIHYFSADKPEERQDDLINKIKELRRVAATFPNRLHLERKSIAILVPRDRSRCGYADRKTLKLIEEAADLAGFTIEVLAIPIDHNAFFALKLDKYEAVILDVRGTDLPEWAFAYVYGRLIPSIKLVRVRPNEMPAEVQLPPLVKGLRMDEREPGVESVTYWRDADDLVWQLARAFCKLDEEQTVFKTGRQGDLYFESIGRRPARVFISNANKANRLAHRLSEELRLRNIEQFQYKEPDAISPGSNWQQKILSEVDACNVFVALIGQGYEKSEWCIKEMKRARARLPQLQLLPYTVEKTDVSFMGKLQVAALPTDADKAVSRVLEEIQRRLTRDEHGANRRLRRTTLLGASRESTIDAIRHISRAAWPKLLSQIRDAGVTVSTPDRDDGPVRQREIAEQLFMDVQRSDFEPSENDVMEALMRALADLAPAKHRAVSKDVARRIAARPSENSPDHTGPRVLFRRSLPPSAGP